MVDLLIGRNPAPSPNPGFRSPKLPPGVQPLGLSPDGHFVTVQGPDDFRRIEVATGNVTGSVPQPLDNLSAASMSDDGRIVAVSTLAATTQVLQPARTPAVVPVNAKEPVCALAFSAGGDYLAAGSLLNQLLQG